MRLFLTTILISLVFCINAQDYYETKGSSIYQVQRTATIDKISLNNEIWDVQLKSFTPSENKGLLNREELQRIKNSVKDKKHTTNSNRGFVEAPFLNQNFDANRGNGGVPPDNTLAVSDNGFIVSSINSNILFTRADNKVLYSAGLADFFVDLSLGGGYFDPKVLFDPEEKKFIVVALSGSKANVSNVAIAFSKTEDPSLGWNFYKIKGDILNEKVWFDYPNIGVSADDLFVTGNMFTDENSFRYSAILQIDKLKAFSGEPLSYKHYTKMKETSSGQMLFNMTPCPSGWSNNIPGPMTFLTNDNRGGNVLVVTEVSGNLASNPTFKVKKIINVDPYDIPQDATMKGSDDQLETFDCRIMQGISLNGIIHYVFKVTANGFAAINYSRYNPATNINTETIFSEPNMHISYPSIVAFGKDQLDSKVMINYLRSNETIYPEQAVVVCEGAGNSFSFSEPTLLHKGEGIVAALSGIERWGDYTTLSRRFSNDEPEVWAFGCYGLARYGSWIGQFINKNTSFNDFYADKTVINEGDTIAFSTLGTDSLVVIDYELEGGTKLASFDSLHQASYATIGSYDATLKAVTDQNDTITVFKNNFIQVVPVVFPPESDFQANKTIIFEGDSVSFVSLSTNDPYRFKWTFSGGTPSTSDLANPTVKYTKKGSYLVVLNAKNSAGEDVEVKQKYITVNAKPLAPLADFAADKLAVNTGDTIRLTDLSTNNPTDWEWIISINGSNVSDTFNVQNPVITLQEFGEYNVSLKSSNTVGENIKLKERYITVGSVAVKEELIANPQLYPNPINDDKVYLTFELNTSKDLSFSIYDTKGMLVKKLIEKNVKAGQNELSFNTDLLAKGMYNLVITESNAITSKQIKFVKL
jgi:PKD repeat protein